MRRALLLLAGLLSVSACRTVSTEPRMNVPDAATKPVASAVVDAAVADPPLAWGTRPPKDGPLYPVIDGTCMRAEIWPVGTTAILTNIGAMKRLDDDGIIPGDEVLAASDSKAGFSEPDIRSVIGTWPSPLVIYGEEHGMGRMRSYDSTWYRDAKGWALLGSYREKTEPSYTPPLLHRGWFITARSSQLGPSTYDGYSAHLMVAYPAVKDAAPIPGLMQLARANLFLYGFAANDTTIYAFGGTRSEGNSVLVIRILKDGKISEVRGGGKAIGTTSTALYILDDDRVSRLEDGKITKLAYKPPKDVRVVSASLAPSGDVWLLTSRNVVVVLHGDEVTETPLPAPATPLAKEKVVYAPRSGAALAGVEIGDPYAIGEGGALFHLVGTTWTEVPLPASPFATTGKYKAQSLYLPAKGDLYVNAGYVEKGVGWSTTNGYRAILRTKRPKEVLRCQEPQDEVRGSSRGVMSFPPLADETCKTPVVILLRIGWGEERSFPADFDYPSVRAAIKATPSLGTTVDLVEVVSGRQRFIAAKVPSLAAGQELARQAVKMVKVEFFTVKPEVVCGTPKEERVVHVDVASGSVTK